VDDVKSSLDLRCDVKYILDISAGLHSGTEWTSDASVGQASRLCETVAALPNTWFRESMLAMTLRNMCWLALQTLTDPLQPQRVFYLKFVAYNLTPPSTAIAPNQQ
jgi:hypothetical protein